MILAWLVAAAAASVPAPPPLVEASKAIEAGRLDQARIMIGKAVAAGAQGAAVDRLLADLAFRSGDMPQALSRYETLASTTSASVAVVEGAGLSALKLGQWARGRKWIEQATAMPDASWKAWNALGILADVRSDFRAADRAYDKALQLSPDEPDLLNNFGWSLMLRGRWADAVRILERGRRIDPRSSRLQNNLELARAAIADDLPMRRPGESDEEWSARLNDAGVAAQLNGDNARALAAFTRAIEARPVWFERAANNLKQVQAGR